MIADIRQSFMQCAVNYDHSSQPLYIYSCLLERLHHAHLKVIDKIAIGWTCRCGGSTTLQRLLDLVFGDVLEASQAYLNNGAIIAFAIGRQETQLLVQATVVTLEGRRGIRYVLVAEDQCRLGCWNVQLLDAILLLGPVGGHIASILSLCGNYGIISSKVTSYIHPHSPAPAHAASKLGKRSQRDGIPFLD